MKVMGIERRAPPPCPPSTFTVIGSCIRALLGAKARPGRRGEDAPAEPRGYPDTITVVLGRC
jgi:hypothetical protein